MLVKFSVANYLSIDDKITFSLKAESLREQFTDYNTVETPFKDIILLKSSALYGYNSSGKSNILKAIDFVRDFVLNSFREYQANEEIPVEEFKFSNELIQKKNSFFEIEFIQYDTLYRYGFELNRSAVKSEWLYHKTKGQEKNYFIREYQDFKVSDTFREGGRGKDITRPNALFLSVLAQQAGNISQMVIGWFQNLISISDTNYNYFVDYTAKLISTTPEIQEMLSRVLKSADIGFNELIISKQEVDETFYSYFSEDIRKAIVSKMPALSKIETVHKVYDFHGNHIRDQRMDFRREESLGTQKFFALAGCIVETLLEGKVMMVDELDARLHPNLTNAIIKLFNSPRDNKKGAQLIFSVHNTNILNQKVLRRDQINVVRKNKMKATEIGSLYEYKLRNDATYEKEILSEKFTRSNSDKKIQLNIFPDEDF